MAIISTWWTRKPAPCGCWTYKQAWSRRWSGVGYSHLATWTAWATTCGCNTPPDWPIATARCTSPTLITTQIKRLEPETRRVETVIGAGAPGHNDGAFGEATLDEPEGIAAQGQRLYIADTNNHQIRVADLATATVRTLLIADPHGILAQRRSTERLAPVVVGRGEITIRLHVALPAGYKPNPDAPLTLQTSGSTHTFEAHEQPRITVEVEHSHELALNLVAYPCAIADGLCLIHDVWLIVPLVVAADGPRSVDLYYTVPATL